MVVVVVLCLVLLSGCFYPLRVGKTEQKTYEYQVNDSDGILVEDDGIQYVALPETKWESEVIGDFLGYAGNEKKDIYAVENDEAKNFLFIYDSALCPFGDMHEILLYKKGLVNPTGDNINRLLWGEYESKGSYAYKNTITDKSVIKELFDDLESNEPIPDASFFGTGERLFVINITCYSDDVKGAQYNLDIKHYKGNIVCGKSLEGYVIVSTDLIEKIAGHELQLEEYLNES
jgi:hypothetical protein